MIEQVIKPNLWRIEQVPQELFFSRKMLSRNRSSVLAVQRIKDGWLYLGSPRKDCEIVEVNTLGDSVLQNLLTQLFYSLFENFGLSNAKAGKTQKFFWKDNAKKVKDFYVHDGFEFSVAKFKEVWLLLIHPICVLTGDGEKYENWLAAEKNSEFLSLGKGLTKYANLMKIFNKVGILLNSDDFASQGERIGISLKSAKPLGENAIIDLFPEPEIDFGNGKYAHWPKSGLQKYGPLDFNDTHSKRLESISITFIGTNQAFSFLKSLGEGKVEGKSSFPGFENLFYSKLEIGNDRFINLEEAFKKVKIEQDEIVEFLLQKQISLKNQGIQSDLTLIFLPKELEHIFVVNRVKLRDIIKVRFWEKNICTQIITQNSLNGSQVDTLFNISLGIYFKSGGYPWRLRTNLIDVAYIGISFGISRDQKSRLVGVAEMFDCYGQFIAIRSVTGKVLHAHLEEKDLHLRKDELNKLMTALLEDYSSTMNDNMPKELIVHKTSTFNENELEGFGILESNGISISLVHIQSDHYWQIISSDEKEPPRGFCWKITNQTALFYTQGRMGNQRYFLPGSPNPLLVNLVKSNRFSLHDICGQILGLTKLNYNSTNTYSKEPATLLYARRLISFLRAGMAPSALPEDPRFFL